MLGSSSVVTIAATLLLTAVALAATWRRSRSSRRRDYPPGPPGKLFIGNLLLLSPQAIWVKLTEYKDVYGDLIFFHGLGNYILVLNTMEAIVDLLEKRPHIYSDRPTSVSTHELIGMGKTLPMLPYDEEWKAQRKLLRHGLNPTAVRGYRSTQESLAVLLAQQLLQNPNDFIAHIRLATSKTMLSVGYGLSVEEAEKDFLAHAEETMAMLSEVTVPGAFLCDFVPFLKHLPRWFPFQKKARVVREMFESMMARPMEHVKKQMEQGLLFKGMAKDLLLMDTSNSQEHNERVTWAIGGLYGAGGESTYATILACVLAMVLHPDKQRKLQQELDEVIGYNNLPTINDRSKLPYLCAVIKETFRWHPPLPISLPRCTAHEDTYQGYTIPKGTIVIPNSWALAFERQGRYDPYDFVPERFLEDDNTDDPTSWAFGFGRRQCPGKLLAEDSMFIYLATIFACFDLSPPAGGAPIRAEFSKGIVSYPLPFGCQFTARSAERVALLLDRAAHVTG